MTEGDYLDKEDHYIYERIKEFLFAEEVSRLPGAKQLLVVLERAVCSFSFGTQLS